MEARSMGRFEGQATVIRRRNAFLVPAVAGAVMPLVIVPLGGPPWLLGVGFGAGLLSVALGHLPPFLRRQLGRVAVTSSAVTLDGELLLARSAVRRAVRISDQGRIAVTSRSGLLDAELRFDTDAEARAFEDAVSPAPALAPAYLKAYAPPGWTGAVVGYPGFLAVVIIGIGLLQRVPDLSLRGMLALALLVAIMSAGVVLFIGTRLRIHVGPDGLLVRRGWRPARFISYADIRGVEVFGRGVRFPLGSGETLTVVGDGARSTEGVRSLAAQVERVKAAMNERPDPDVGELFAPGDRPLGDWAREMRQLTSAPRYRELAVTAERLWRVVDDPLAPAASRIGAGLALSRDLSAGDRGRLRAISESCANPVLRSAMHRIAEGAGDEELESDVASLLSESHP
jgi:hypothetical protein